MDQGENVLLPNGAVADRPEYVQIKPCITCQLLGIDLVALPITVRDRSQLMDVRYDEFVAQFLQLCADLDRVHSSFHRNPRWKHIGESPLDRILGRPEASPINELLHPG